MVGEIAHDCREQAQAAQIELLTHRLVEARMVVLVQTGLLAGDEATPFYLRQLMQYVVDLERRMAEMGRNGEGKEDQAPHQSRGSGAE